MTLQQMLAYANGGVAASASRCPGAQAKYRHAAAQANVALMQPEYARFAAKLSVLNMLLDADRACDAEWVSRTTAEAAAQAVRPTVPTPTPKPTPKPTPATLKAGLPWWAWAGLAVGGVMLLTGKKKKGKKRSKKRRRR
jgi:hypothetical protein